MEKRSLIKVMNLRASYELVQEIKTQFLSVPEIKSILALRRELKSELDNTGTLQSELFSSYGVEKSTDDTYKWNEHENVEEITKKMSDILNMCVEVNNVNFISEESFYKSVSGMSINNIDFLESILVSRDDRSE